MKALISSSNLTQLVSKLINGNSLLPSCFNCVSWVYLAVVFNDAWPSNTYSERKSNPPSSKCVAKQWRSECGLTSLLIWQSRNTCLMAFWMPPLSIGEFMPLPSPGKISRAWWCVCQWQRRACSVRFGRGTNLSLPPFASRIWTCMVWLSISWIVRFKPSLNRRPMLYRVRKNTW